MQQRIRKWTDSQGKFKYSENSIILTELDINVEIESVFHFRMEFPLMAVIHSCKKLIYGHSRSKCPGHLHKSVVLNILKLLIPQKSGSCSGPTA